MFLRPAGIGGRVLGAGTGVVFGVLRRVTGVDLLEELSVFFRAMGGMIGEIVDRADRVGQLLSDPETTFLLVTSAERDPVEETIYFHRRLKEQKLPFGGLVVNRARLDPPSELGEDDAAALGEAIAEQVREAAEDLAVIVERDAAGMAHLQRSLATPPTIVVPQLPGDVHDLEGLALVCRHLFG
jgi:anion-transporting  ArsA/GET3 family ATPase